MTRQSKKYIFNCLGIAASQKLFYFSLSPFTIGIIKASLLDGQITVDQVNGIPKKMTDSGFYSPTRKIDDLK
jgi:hypothetical protein